MEKRTIKTLLILICLLFINIEAAQAGLVKELRHFVDAHFSEPGLLISLTALLFGGGFTAIVLLPVKIGSEKKVWFTDIEPGIPTKFAARRQSVARIAKVLESAPLKKAA
jgi:hypothetical protein